MSKSFVTDFSAVCPFIKKISYFLAFSDGLKYRDERGSSRCMREARTGNKIEAMSSYSYCVSCCYCPFASFMFLSFDCRVHYS